jgi:hypothetical protein
MEWLSVVRPVGIEPTQNLVPETSALSTELRAQRYVSLDSYLKYTIHAKNASSQSCFKLYHLED